jgi:hypothetical protein
LFFLSLLLAKRVCVTVLTVVEERLKYSGRVRVERDARTSAGPAALGAREEREEKRERGMRVRDSLRSATTVTCRG